MDFFRIINALFSVIAWLIVLAIIWAVSPYALKFIHAINVVHDFGK